MNIGDRNIPPRKGPGFAKYDVDTNLFRLESSILTRAKRATNWNNVATEKRGGGGIFRGGVYLEPDNQPMSSLPVISKIFEGCSN